MTDSLSADRLEIGELLARYAWCIVDKDWSGWQACFTEDGRADYTTAGGIAGSAAAAVVWLEQTMAMFDVSISHVGNVVIDFAGDDNADVRSTYKMVMRIPGETPTYLEACGWYADKVTRTPTGWRLADRFEHLLYVR